jgi:hypothetical protein
MLKCGDKVVVTVLVDFPLADCMQALEQPILFNLMREEVLVELDMDGQDQEVLVVDMRDFLLEELLY